MPKESIAPCGRLPAPLLNPRMAAQKFQLTRFEPSGDLNFFVQNHWIVEWDLRDSDPYVQHILPYPCVNLVFETTRSVVSGVTRGRASRQIEGRGCAVGIKFKPGGFYPFLHSSVAALTNRLVPATQIFGPGAKESEARIFSTKNREEQVSLAESFLRELKPLRDDTVATVAQLVERIADDREITKVEQLLPIIGVSERTLQRLFLRYVGINPKWVIRLYRLQEAANAARTGEAVDWAGVAGNLGYFDQAHFSKDFKKVVGQSPAAYARETNKVATV